MNDLIKFRYRNTQQYLLTLPFFILVSLNSCNSKPSDSDLTSKVNAVQKQMMKQGNITNDEKQAFLNLKKMITDYDSSDNSIVNAANSELIGKVNLVQKQIIKQGNISEKEKQEILSLVSLVINDDGFDGNIERAIPFDDVENAPIYSGCENLSNEETKKCFHESITNFIIAEFNSEIAENLNISEVKTVDAFFQVDKNGMISNIKVRDSEVTIQAEIARVLRKIPRMKPATQNGKNVPILHSIQVSYGNK